MESQTVVPILAFHWKQIQEMTGRIKCPSNWIQGLCFFFASTVITTGIVLNLSSASIPENQTLLYMTLFGVSLVLTPTMFGVDRILRKQTEVHIKILMKYLKDIDETLPSIEKKTDIQTEPETEPEPETVAVLEMEMKDEATRSNLLRNGVAAALQGSGIYVGSINSDIYHTPSCEAAKHINSYNKIWFKSDEEAKKKGYSPCGTCIWNLHNL